MSSIVHHIIAICQVVEILEPHKGQQTDSGADDGDHIVNQLPHCESFGRYNQLLWPDKMAVMLVKRWPGKKD